MKVSLWKKLEYGIDEENASLSSSINYFGGMHDISEKRLGADIPYIHLWIAVLVDAAKYRDYDFIKSHHKTICTLARLDYKTILRAFNTIWKREDDCI